MNDYRVDTPSLLDGDESWEVSQDAARVPSIDKVHRRVVLPPGISEAARSIVRHEMGHGLWSAEKPVGGVYKQVHAYVEDAIINKRWEAIRQRLVLDEEIAKGWQDQLDYLAGADRIQAILYAIGCIGWFLPDGKPVADLEKAFGPPGTKDRGFLSGFEKSVEKYVSTPVDPEDAKGRKQLVREVLEYIKIVDKEENPKLPPPRPQPQGNNIHGNTKVTVSVGPDGKPRNSEEIAKAQKEAKTKGDAAAAKPRKKRDRVPVSLRKSLKESELEEKAKISRVQNEIAKTENVAEAKKSQVLKTLEVSTQYKPVDIDLAMLEFSEASHGFGKPPNPEPGQPIKAHWGEAEFAKPILTEKDPSIQFKGRAYRPTDEGVIIKYPDRELTDGKMFGLKNTNKKGGGSLMLDWSGSMSLSSREVLKLIKNCPRRTTVACYSGHHTEGRIILCAEKGRYIDETTLHKLKNGGGNVIDGPAVAWLCRQAKPRIWIADGQIFGMQNRVVIPGKGSSMRPSTDQDLAEGLLGLMLRYDVKRCENIFQAKLVLNGHVTLNHPMFEDTYTARGRITRTTEAAEAWRTYQREHANEEWYKELSKQSSRFF